MTDTEKTNTDIAVTQKDFEEPSEDVSGSPLWNKDLAPTSICFWVGNAAGGLGSALSNSTVLQKQQANFWTD